jgi:uncharacterized protein YigA (DUF484 family)
MLRVKPIERDVIDQWPVTQSGLPARVVNSAQAAGIETIGQLRRHSNTDLLKLRSLGRISIRYIRRFFQIYDRIEKGTQYFNNIREVLDLFLDRDEFIVLAYRYGFDLQGAVASRKSMTLQEIGNRENRTRERIRQIEETAVIKLQSQQAQCCLQPFYDYFHQIIESLGKAAACRDLLSRIDTALMHQFNGCGVLLALCDLKPGPPTYYNGAFSTLTPTTLQEIESHLLQYMEQQDGPVALDTLYACLSTLPGFEPAPAMRRVAQVLLDHSPQVASSVNNRYFLFDRGMAAFLSQVMQTIQLPAHFRHITRACNALLKPQCRKGAGYILELLNTHPGCQRVDRGIYTLKHS